MKKIRELLSSDHVSSDEEMGDAEEPSSSTSKERKKGGQKGKEIIEMYSYTINLVEMADTAEGGRATMRLRGSHLQSVRGSQDVQGGAGAGM